MRIFVLTATYELRVSRKNQLRDHPTDGRGGVEEEPNHKTSRQPGPP